MNIYSDIYGGHMPIKYRAMHEKMSWKRVGSHLNLDSAINGDKGAKTILKGKTSYAQKLWRERGKPLCIFVWEEGRQPGHIFRINPISPQEVQEARVSVDVLEQYDKQGGCAQSEIDGHFRTSLPPATDASPKDDSQPASSMEAMEGLIHEAKVLSRSRNATLRNAALAQAKGKCEVCSVVFSTMLGGKGHHVLQVHHRQQLALRDVPSPTRIEDLAVVCANCHALIHTNPKDALSVEQLRALLAAEQRDV